MATSIHPSIPVLSPSFLYHPYIPFFQSKDFIYLYICIIQRYEMYRALPTDSISESRDSLCRGDKNVPDNNSPVYIEWSCIQTYPSIPI